MPLASSSTQPLTQAQHLGGAPGETAGTVFPTGTECTIESGATLNIDGTWKIGGTAITATAAEINAAAGTGVSSTELGYLDGALATNAVASKAFITGTAGAIAIAGDATIGDGKNVVVSGTTGTKIGTATSQKLGFWNATPIVQPAAAAQAALTNSSGGSADATIEAVGATNTGDVSGAINNNFTELHTLLDAIRTALVNAGIIKGAA